MSELTIRPRGDDDIPGCVAALATVHAADRYPVDWPVDPEGWLTPPGLLGAWVAVDGGDVLGHMALTRPMEAPPVAVGLPARRLVGVARLFVDLRARRRGVAARLLDEATRVAADRGRTPVLEVEAGATSAIRLYERAGWSRVGSSAGDWTTADGRVARLLWYVAPSAGGGRG
ncbi:GNAT family N-acetyltransferase [Streptomyces sp. DH12]|uniref:GNAT family N-acetyltransferase n=1 Tax=Streptomyces sp. DH12 TaxID=2857010 RepID=UPI001E424290|nr:GNAT family N-acetyltransferase [Streptomyces sp. DH12]